MDKIIEWLLEGPPWVIYRTRLELLGEAEDSPDVAQAREAMLAHPQVQGLVAELAEWPGSLLSSHKSAGHLLHKLIFVADLGLKQGDQGIDIVIDRILKHQANTGPFQVLMNIPPHFGGSGEDVWAWALCDAPLILYALVKFGLGDDPRVQMALEHLLSLVTEHGWPCGVSPELGRFRGPGRKDDPCPYANLVMLKTLALRADWQSLPASQTGAETLLRLWEGRLMLHPYQFYMGTDFCKLKAPLVWYDVLHVADVLTRFPWLCSDPRLITLVDVMREKAGEEGRFTPGSIWTAWKDWDFGQKKEPSHWLTLLAHRIFRRMG